MDDATTSKGNDMSSITWDTTDSDNGTNMVDITDMTDAELDALLGADDDDDDDDLATMSNAALDTLIASMTIAPSAAWMNMVAAARAEKNPTCNAAAYHKSTDGADYENAILAEQERF